MSGSQSVTEKPKITKSIGGVVTAEQEQYISYVAVSGLIINEDGSFTKMSVDEFCQKFGVYRKKLQRWRETIPNFTQRVEDRRDELMSTNRISAIWKSMTLKAMAGNVEAAKLVLGQYAKWRPPAQKHEVEIGDGMAEALRIAQERKETITVEGEVVENGTTASSDS